MVRGVIDAKAMATKAQAMANGRLPPVRQEFLDSIGDLPPAATGTLPTRIDQAHSLRDLWHLRAELYHVLALNHDQRVAEQRLTQLNRHFPTRAPRSGFVPLLS